MTSFIELFSGAGGLSLGLSAAGWQPLLAIDNWSDAVDTYRENFRDHPVLLQDIHSVDERVLATNLNEAPDWIVGGPPCQGFSTVGTRKRDDPRNQLVQEFARIVRILEPRGFLVENVVGLRDMDFVTSVSELFSQLGYTVSAHVVRASDYGVPQLRHRIFFVGRRDGAKFVLPSPTHGSQPTTVWDAIGDLPEVRPGEVVDRYLRDPQTTYQRNMRHGSTGLQGHQASAHPPRLVEAISFIPDGGNRLSIPPRLQPSSGFHNSYSRLHSRSPAIAVTQNMGKPSGSRCIHPFQNRGLTAREGARLQGFPDRFHFSAGVTSQRLQVANAVSPILAEFIGRSLAHDDNWI